MRALLVIALLFVAIPAVNADDDAGHWQNYARTLLARSVEFRSVHGTGEVVLLAEYLAEQFLEHGFDPDDVRLLPMDSRGEAVASLVVRYRGTSGKLPILFVAHMDVVDAAGGDWQWDPFVMTEHDGYFYGRGVIDDKFGTTVLTATFARLKSEGFEPERDLIIAFTGDEETHMDTIQKLVTDYRQLIDAEFAINVDAGWGLLNDDGEPVLSNLQFAEKTYATFELITRNSGGHSSQPKRDNAIFDIADAIKAVQAHEFPVHRSEEVIAYFRKSAPLLGGDVGEAMQRFASDPNDQDAVEFLSSIPDFVGILRTTCIPTMIEGGHVENALPEKITLTVNCRIYPGEDVDDVRDALFRVIDNEQLEIRQIGDAYPSPASPVSLELIALVEAAIARQYPGVPVIPYMAPYGTDALHLRRAGIPTYGSYGVFLKVGDDKMHSSGERLPVKGFYEALDYWNGLMRDLASF